MSDVIAMERGRPGRIVYARVRPNEDLVLAIEKLCLNQGLVRCAIRGSLGSLTDAQVLGPSGNVRVLRGPAIEVVGMTGEVRPDPSGSPSATVSGVVCAPDGTLTGGRFVRGENPVCVTFELILEEWHPTDAADATAAA